MIEEIICDIYGSKEMAFSCTHIVIAIDEKEKLVSNIQKQRKIFRKLPGVGFANNIFEIMAKNGLMLFKPLPILKCYVQIVLTKKKIMKKKFISNKTHFS